MLEQLGRWKWLLVAAIFAGPAFAYFSNKEVHRIEHIMTDGVELTAAVNGGEVSTRRGVSSYKFHLDWVDPSGAAHADDVRVSSEFAGRAVVDDALIIDQTQIKYLASEAETPMVIVEDAPRQIANKKTEIMLGLGAGLLGLLGAPLLFWIERRQRKKQEEEADATLARMRNAGSQ